jgi:hypothetical protein
VDLKRSALKILFPKNPISARTGWGQCHARYVVRVARLVELPSARLDLCDCLRTRNAQGRPRL